MYKEIKSKEIENNCYKETKTVKIIVIKEQTCCDVSNK